MSCKQNDDIEYDVLQAYHEGDVSLAEANKFLEGNRLDVIPEEYTLPEDKHWACGKSYCTCDHDYDEMRDNEMAYGC